ncbi:MAG: hypothetical protein IKO16_05725 [Lachnospiraceae bacterium]|nr:hypothetical protein [Lachnospiraceae bacterium]
MSTAKALVMDKLNMIPDDIQDEVEVLEGLYKQLKLERSKRSVNAYGTLSTDEVRKHVNERRKVGMTAV